MTIITRTLQILSIFAGGFLFAVGLSFFLTSCEPDAPPLKGQAALPAEQNFEPSKIWTEADFKQAEIDPLDVDYLAQERNSGFVPDNVTAEDIQLIREHNQKRLARLQAGKNPTVLAKE